MLDHIPHYNQQMRKTPFFVMHSAVDLSHAVLLSYMIGDLCITVHHKL
jgi:hypothetical protein